MRWLEVKKSQPLRGEISVPGSKNSSLGLMAACCLADEPVILKNIPNILDIRVMLDISKNIGLVITRGEKQLFIDPRKIHSAVIESRRASSFRASYYYIGALLAKFQKVTIGYPGGDNFGSRPIDQHIKGLSALGAKFTFYEDYYTVTAEKLTGAEIYFDLITMGATINTMLAAVKAKGKTVLYNAARDPEVVDVAIFLNKMGANIKGAGTDKITIQGVGSLSGCTHSAIPDRLVVGTFLMAAGITGGKLTIAEIIPEHLYSCLAKLTETGLSIEIGDDYLTAAVDKQLQAINVRTGMYPGFGTDFQQPLTTMLTKAVGKSVVIDNIFPKRFTNCSQLNRMGAKIIVQDGQVIIPGNCSLKGTWVQATDVRAGISLILAGLVAEGTTYITGIEHIERGYVDIVATFSSLGAHIKLRQDDQLKMDLQKEVLQQKIVE